MRRWRLYLILMLVLFSLAGVVNLVIDRLTREPPDYAWIESGFYMGGYVPEPPDGTGAVLNLCEIEDPYQVEFHRWRPIRDTQPAPTLDWLQDQVDFITEQRKAGRTVFVHCNQGASRSGLVVVAYVMAQKNWQRDRAVEFVRSHRPELRPNPAFMELLLEQKIKK